MNNKPWDNLHKFYKDQGWIDKPNIFAKEILKYIPKNAKILELGAGQGQDTRFFAQNGFNVTSTDISDPALELNKSKLPADLKNKVEIKKVDMGQKLPFKDSEFDVVYAHLSLHYFDLKKTQEIIDEVYRVLKDKGLFIMLNNSTSDPEYKTGKEIEKDYFLIGDVKKRFFSVNSSRNLTTKFNPVLLDNQGETYKDAAKGVHNLIRYVGERI